MSKVAVFVALLSAVVAVNSKPYNPFGRGSSYVSRYDDYSKKVYRGSFGNDNSGWNTEWNTGNDDWKPKRSAWESNDDQDKWHHYPSYKFEYGVKDPHTHDHHSQWEHREGDTVHGEYTLDEADGTKRVVRYTADGINGFTAHVERIGHAKHHHGDHHHDKSKLQA